MVLELKLRKMGKSVGVLIPKKALVRLKVVEGDTLILTESQDGVRLTAGNSDFLKTMAVFNKLNRRYRNSLRELAK
jgi:putative addiction module antidote